MMKNILLLLLLIASKSSQAQVPRIKPSYFKVMDFLSVHTGKDTGWLLQTDLLSSVKRLDTPDHVVTMLKYPGFYGLAFKKGKSTERYVFFAETGLTAGNKNGFTKYTVPGGELNKKLTAQFSSRMSRYADTLNTHMQPFMDSVCAFVARKLRDSSFIMTRDVVYITGAVSAQPFPYLAFTMDADNGLSEADVQRIFNALFRKANQLLFSNVFTSGYIDSLSARGAMMDRRIDGRKYDEFLGRPYISDTIDNNLLELRLGGNHFLKESCLFRLAIQRLKP